MKILEVLYALLIVYIGVSVLYLLAYAVLGKIPRKIKKPLKNKQNRFAVFIPAYKEDNIICDIALKALDQNYPEDLYDVIVIADSFQQKTLDNLSLLPIILKEVSFKKSTKAKALKKAMSELPDNYYDVAMVMDADNILAIDFITKINDSINAGYHVVQGHRTAKNIEGFAMLDAMSEEINNNIYSKGHRTIGLSSRLVGSGLAVTYQLFKNTISNVDVVHGGEDKELELRLLRGGYNIEYRDDAICYDEKVSQVEVFNDQRIRWISAQYHYFKKDFLPAIWSLVTNGNIEYFNKAFQMMLPPRLILLGFLFVSVCFTFFFSSRIYFYLWTGFFLANIFSSAISIPNKFYSKQMVNAFMLLPKAFFGIFGAFLFNIIGKSKTTTHTPHICIEVEDKKDLKQRT